MPRRPLTNASLEPGFGADLLDRFLLMRSKALSKNTRIVISLLHELSNIRA